MGTTAEKLNKLLDTKAAIKSAIVEKGQAVADTDTFASYAEKIRAIDTLESGTTDATAATGDILSGKTAYVGGSKVTGTMTNNGAKTASLNAGGSYTIPAGYHNGSGKVTANSLSSQTSGTATAADILSGETAWVGGSKITGTIATKTASDMTASGATITAPAGYYASAASKSVATATQATPSISVDSAGLITASATQSAGYVSAGTKSSTSQLTTQAATTITPGTTNKTAVNSGVYTTGAVTVSGDINLVAENIKSGVSIFGVTGSLESTALTEDGYITKIVTHEDITFNFRHSTYSNIDIPNEYIPSDLRDDATTTSKLFLGWSLSLYWADNGSHRVILYDMGSHEGWAMYDNSDKSVCYSSLSTNELSYSASANNGEGGYYIRIPTNCYNAWGSGDGSVGSITFIYASNKKYMEL